MRLVSWLAIAVCNTLWELVTVIALVVLMSLRKE